jgi:chorismate synthase
MMAIDEAKAEGDTLGGVFEIIATGVPVGLGSHVQWDRRLDGQIAQAIMSINTVKGIEIGAGFSIADVKGSQAQDIIEPSPERTASRWNQTTNRAGGVEGGISNGQHIVVRAVVKPIATLGKPLPSIDLRTGKKADAHYERSDICVVPAAGVIGEAMLAIVLTGTMLEKFGGDHLKETAANYKNYISSVYSRKRHAKS